MPHRLDRVTIALPTGDIAIRWYIREALLHRLQHIRENRGLRAAFTAARARWHVVLDEGRRAALHRALVDWSADGMPTELEELRDRLTDEALADA
jgi:hypothetical protein